MDLFDQRIGMSSSTQVRGGHRLSLTMDPTIHDLERIELSALKRTFGARTTELVLCVSSANFVVSAPKVHFSVINSLSL